MKTSRRNFGRTLALSAVAAPFAPEALSQQPDQASPDTVELRMKIIDAPLTPERAQQVRAFLRQTTSREISKLRSWPVRRDTPPALGLGVFDSDE